MKLTFFLSILTIAQLWATETYSQFTKLTLRLENVKISEALREIEERSEFFFLYSPKLIDVERKVTIDAEKETIRDILTDVFADQVRFAVYDRQIILTPKDQTEVLTAFQQQKVTGKVTDKSGASLPGVSVAVKGTTIGATTDIDGNFSLTLPPEGKILVVSFVGMNTQEVTIGDQTRFNIVLEESAIGLEEIVVIGYGTAKRKDVTGSVASLKTEEIMRSNPVAIAKALQGQVAGINVTKSNSRPGADYNIDIRGLHSINYSSTPLVVIDGVIGGSMITLNPVDIATVDVLKDASATAIYGSRGANGVIVITTKRGAPGKTKITYDGYIGLKVPNHLPEMMTAQDFYQAYAVDRVADGGSAATFTSNETAIIDAGNSTDWINEVTNPGLQTSHIIAASGGTEHTTHYFSAGYLNEKGNILNTGYQKYNLKGTIDSKINNVVRIGFSSYYTYSKQNLGSSEALRSAYRVRPTGVLLYDDLVNPAESTDKDYQGYAIWMGINDHQCMNPVIETIKENTKNEVLGNSFLGNGYLELNILKGLTLRTSLSVTADNFRTGSYYGSYTKQRNLKLPSASYSTNNNSAYTLDNILTYKYATRIHDLTITAIQSAMQFRSERSGTNVEYLPYTSYFYAIGTATTINSVSSSLTERSLLSYMGRINYSLKDRYLITLTGRYDGSSVLAEGNKWAFFPSAAIAWRASEESFIKNLNVFSDLKIRLSYGVVGNDVVTPYATQAYLAKTAYDFGGTDAYGFAATILGNADLKWEKSAEYNLGFNIGFLKNRITTEIELYNRKTVDLIQAVSLPTSSGFSSVTANVGKLLNMGIEITLNTINIKTPNLTWSTNINFSSNHNEILELYGGTTTTDISNKLFVGQSLKSNYYYKFDGIWQTDEAAEAAVYGQVPGSVKVVDQNKDNLISSNTGLDDRVILGSELPKWLAGLRSNLNYKNFDFSFFIYTRQGVQFANQMLKGTMGELGSVRYNKLKVNYWTTSNPTNDYFGVVAANPYREAITYQDASFVRVSDITLGYTLPHALTDKIKISNIRLYLQVTNPFLYTKFISLDPEFNSNTSNDDVPSSTSILGISVSF